MNNVNTGRPTDKEIIANATLLCSRVYSDIEDNAIYRESKDTAHEVLNLVQNLIYILDGEAYTDAMYYNTRLHDHKDTLTMVYDLYQDSGEYGFEFEGTHIVDPRYDESMRFSVEPCEYYGLDNVKAYVKVLDKLVDRAAAYKEAVAQGLYPDLYPTEVELEADEIIPDEDLMPIMNWNEYKRWCRAKGIRACLPKSLRAYLNTEVAE